MFTNRSNLALKNWNLVALICHAAEQIEVEHRQGTVRIHGLLFLTSLFHFASSQYVMLVFCQSPIQCQLSLKPLVLGVHVLLTVSSESQLFLPEAMTRDLNLDSSILKSCALFCLICLFGPEPLREHTVQHETVPQQMEKLIFASGHIQYSTTPSHQFHSAL